MCIKFPDLILLLKASETAVVDSWASQAQAVFTTNF